MRRFKAKLDVTAQLIADVVEYDDGEIEILDVEEIFEIKEIDDVTEID